MSSRSVVVVLVAYEAPHVIVVTVVDPQGTDRSETVRLSGDVGAAAQRQAQAAWGDVRIDLDLRLASPPWLAEDDFVRIQDHAMDPDDRGGSPYGRIEGFLPIGGVLVTQARAGTGIFAPEDLVVITPDDIDQEALADIGERSKPTNPDIP